ncbi:phosphatidate cytidylyltransferase [Roseococcus sp. SYP-B2431]|uniref:phosphatidate cytidylyltransferase n=1 Tax=Roseococcus sp. SYP-B2431 TaxID=2496640 RepID=UPI0010400697|nr:phosphatidate cytidylyltransferase [Roseococcus sp. SYP-B2431]TCH97660.1 phosphatidate cytidylyltransferase [Roseococcus sp. SYP-B2431]
MRHWGDLRQRVLTAALLGPAALLCVWLGGLWWAALMALCVAGLAWEWVRLCGGSTRALPGALVGAVVLMAGAAAVLGRPGLGLLILALGAPATWYVARTAPGARPFWLAFGILYIGLAGIALVALRHDGLVGRDNVIFLFLVVWASDIAAYAAGRSLGGPKLAPAISPNKTWSGALGGLIGASAVGLGVAWGLGAGGSPATILLVSALLGIATQSGDMLESWIKRRFGVKDSSGLIPGHGGLLDRLDGVLAAAPLAALIGAAAGAGVHLWR